MSEHACLPPSGAGAWVNCSLWPSMQAIYARSASPESLEGEAAHWVLNNPDAGIGTIAPQGVPVTDEMLEGAELWHRTIDPARGERHIEERACSDVVHPENWGTPDVWEFNGTTLRVADYKFGHGIVAAFENWQLINYALLVLGNLKPAADAVIRVEFIVVQPRGYSAGGPVRQWHLHSHRDLEPYAKRLRESAQAAMSPNVKASPGNHCEYCSGRHACGALQAATNTAMDYGSAPYRNDLTTPQLGAELRSLDRAAALIDARRTGLQEQALEALRKGERVPHYRLGRTAGKQEWARPDAEVMALGDTFGVQLRKPPKPITPLQAIKAGLNDKLVTAFSQRTNGSVRLEADDGSEARKVFSQ